MARRLKIYGGQTFATGRQSRTIVAAHNQKDAVMFLRFAGINESLNEFRGYWGETGNETEISHINGVIGRVIAYKSGYDKEIVIQKDTMQDDST